MAAAAAAEQQPETVADSPTSGYVPTAPTQKQLDFVVSLALQLGLRKLHHPVTP